MSIHRATLLASVCLFAFAVHGADAAGSRKQSAAVPVAGGAVASAPAAGAQVPNGPVIQSITVVGNQRIETDTIKSYLLVRVGDPFDPDEIARSLKALYATGLFQNVELKREGNGLVVGVLENPLVNEITFEGRHKLTEEQVKGAVKLVPRAVFTTAQVEADRQALLTLYAKKARFNAVVTPKIIRLPQNRVNVVFEISEGSASLVSRIAFVGDDHFTASKLREVVSSRQEAWFRFLSSSDDFDQERIAYDKELLRRFYLKAGYADFQVVDATAELTPDRSSFVLTFTLHEGKKYKVGKVDVVSNLRDVTAPELRSLVELSPGDTYDGDAVERSTKAIEDKVRNNGFAFVEVSPRVARHPETGTLDLLFNVGEGPRVYVERIDIQGNTVTKDKVLRRQFALAEGDAFSNSVVTKTKSSLEDLGYFGKNIQINSSQGSAPDRAVVTVKVEEKSTGELNLGAGYATDYGPMISAGVQLNNVVGSGIAAGISGSIAAMQNTAQVSVTDPYFMDRNLVTTVSLFHTYVNQNQVSNYTESRAGVTLGAGYQYSDHLGQSWNYSLVQRSLNNLYNYNEILNNQISAYIVNETGSSVLSQLGQTLALDYRDSKTDPHSGSIWQFGSDYAGLGGQEEYARVKLNGNYYVPLQSITGNSDWVLSISGGGGDMFVIGNHPEQIVDRFFLGGDNLRGFMAGGVGPHDMASGDSLGGKLEWNQTTEVRFPLPVSADVGLTGRAFVDMGGLQGVTRLYSHTIPGFAPTYNYSTVGGRQVEVTDDGTIRISTGVGFSWDSPFGLVNIDLGVPLKKQLHDQTEFFRFGVGKRF